MKFLTSISDKFNPFPKRGLAGNSAEALLANASEGGFEKPCVIHTLGSPPEDVVTAFVAHVGGDPSMLNELVKQGYVVGTFKELGEAIHNFKNRYQGLGGKQLSLAANDAAETLLANAAEGSTPFAIIQSDGFLVPFGKFPHKQGLQFFDKDAAEAIVANHNGITAKLTRWVTGGSYPIYVGHPDLPGTKDADKRAYGWIENMRVTDEGLHLSAKWSEAGRELVENAHFKYYSPLWWTKKVKGGIQPIALKSMGLTNDPNIPVPALANEADMEGEEESQTNQEDMNPELLAALGLEEGATAEDALAKIVSLKEAAEAAANAEKIEAPDPDALKKAEDEKIAAEEKARLAEEEKVAANEKVILLEGHITAAAANAVDSAVTAGKITPAERDAKVTEILAANDFTAAVKELNAAAPKVKTTSSTGDLGNAKSRLVLAANDESKAAREERAQLVENEFQATNPNQSLGERKRLAWQRAQKKNPEIFGKA